MRVAPVQERLDLPPAAWRVRRWIRIEATRVCEFLCVPITAWPQNPTKFNIPVIVRLKDTSGKRFEVPQLVDHYKLSGGGLASEATRFCDIFRVHKGEPTKMTQNDCRPLE